MAYTASTVSKENGSLALGYDRWYYETTVDSLSVTQASDYFDDDRFKLDDRIDVKATDGTGKFIFTGVNPHDIVDDNTVGIKIVFLTQHSASGNPTDIIAAPGTLTSDLVFVDSPDITLTQLFRGRVSATNTIDLDFDTNPMPGTFVNIMAVR